MSLQYLVKPETLIGHVLSIQMLQKITPEFISHLDCGHQMPQMWINCLQRVETIPTAEGVQNTQLCIITLDERKQRLITGVGQSGSCCHCGSHSLVASLIAPV